MPRIILGFETTPEIDAHLWQHRVDIDHLKAIVAGHYIVRRNRKQRAAPYLLVGEDDQGRCLVVPIVPTADPDIWRPITAWECKGYEADWLYRRT